MRSSTDDPRENRGPRATEMTTGSSGATGTGHRAGASGVGIDLEHCDHLPVAPDPGAERFYVEHFTPAEIAYCQRQPRPREAFCGLWCAKEAARKCAAEFMHLSPLELEIRHDAQGRPWLAVPLAGKPEIKRDCFLSISHSHDVCVAMCVTRLGGGKS